MSELNYHTTKFFGKFITKRNEKIDVLINKPVYLGLAILETSQIVTYEFWYNYVELKCEEKAKLRYMDIDSFIDYIKTKAIYVNMRKIH